jgi:hypothetical protein
MFLNALMFHKKRSGKAQIMGLAGFNQLIFNASSFDTPCKGLNACIEAVGGFL